MWIGLQMNSSLRTFAAATVLGVNPRLGPVQFSEKIRRQRPNASNEPRAVMIVRRVGSI
jgi:hypothetical protein